MLKNKAKNVKSVSSIGTKKESSLHRSLKFQYSGVEGLTEVQAGSYVCDACTGKGELIEVQTGSFGPLKEKVKVLCLKNKLKIIHPIIIQKSIELFDAKGKLLHRRKSPLKGKTWDLFNSLVYAPDFPLQKNLSIELALIGVREMRIDDGKGSWRRKGIRIGDRFLETWHSSVVLRRPRDYYQFIPFGKDEAFTVRELAEKAGIKAALAGKTLYVLAKIDLIERAGKQGKALVYRLKELRHDKRN